MVRMTEATDEPQSGDVTALSFEAALAELDGLIQKLEGGSIALDDAIAAYERGTKLAQHCEALLDRTERRVSALVVGGDGRPTEQPLAAEPAQPRPPATAPSGGLFDERPVRARAVPPIDPDDVPF